MGPYGRSILRLSSYRGNHFKPNQTKSVSVLVLIKSFTCQSLGENYFGAKKSGWFLGRQPLKSEFIYYFADGVMELSFTRFSQ